ncbi:MAG TPA: penicillin-binding protein 2 [Phycisphaerae bacterium]|nr:penicillin-binding protein 2 [Phycisphaerae bacterium]
MADSRRRPIWRVPHECSDLKDGGDVYLCLDAVIQGFLEEAVASAVAKFGAEWGTGMVVDPNTGRVLAMCSNPHFDPNTYWQADASTMTNRAISCPVEPGSIFKPIIAAAAVEAGLVNFETKIFCEHGRYYAHRGGCITDHGKRYEYLSLREIVVRSSNIGMAKIGELFGNENLYKTVKKFGFGKKTYIELPGESPGMLRPIASWDGYSLRRVPFGQEISVTSLQMAMAFCSLVNGGVLYSPRLIDYITDSAGRRVYLDHPKPVRVLSPGVSAGILDVLRGVVEDKGGTGKNARLSLWSTFGKTGTAQVPGVGGYNNQDFMGSFVGGGPVSNPAVVCLVSIYKPDKSKGHYGGTVAAPAVARVLEQSLEYLRIPPDKINEQWTTVNRTAQ